MPRWVGLCAALATLAVLPGCGEDDLPAVWIGRISSAVLVPGQTVVVFGRGLAAPSVVLDPDASGTGRDVVGGLGGLSGASPDATTGLGGLGGLGSLLPGAPVGLLYDGPNAVRVGGVLAWVTYRDDERLHVLVPWDTPVGATTLVVWARGVPSNPVQVFVAQRAGARLAPAPAPRGAAAAAGMAGRH